MRGATWAEINLDSAMWTVPADRTKGAREHRVALSGQAVALLRAVPAGNAEALVFPSASGKPLSDMTLAAVLRRMKLDVVPHGFRATFKTWASETTNFPREVVEGALAHAGGDKLEAAYNRGDLFGKRAALMGAWGDYCASDAVNMTPLGKGSADA